MHAATRDEPGRRLAHDGWQITKKNICIGPRALRQSLCCNMAAIEPGGWRWWAPAKVQSFAGVLETHWSIATITRVVGGGPTV